MATRHHKEQFPVALPVERTWAVMSDTQHLNQIFFGLAALHVIARDGEKARIRGSFGIFAPEYDEYPWAFEAPHKYKSVRVFTKGLLKRLETTCTLSEKAGEAGHTVVDYDLKLDTANGPLGAIAGAIFMSRLKQGLEQARAFLKKLDAGPGAPLWPPANPLREVVFARAKAISMNMRGLDADEQKAVDALVLYLADASEADVARMRPYELAGTWKLPRQRVLSAFLRSAKSGMLRLSWDLLCPSCEAPTSVETLKDLPQGGHCPACDIDFSAGFDENVEATFSPEPAVRAAERLVFCHGSPSTTKSWLAQFVVEPKQSHELQLALGPGRYRVQAAGIAGGTMIDVKDDGDELARVALEGKELPQRIPILKRGRVKLTIENKSETTRRMQLVHRAFASYAATAADVTALGIFRELFGGEALAPDQHVQIGRRSILFTDLVGSTAMYERIGDAAAYGLVRDHFKLLFGIVDKHGGRVVKTVGDCVMASFDTPVTAARCAREMIVGMHSLTNKEGKPTGLKLRIGVHTGACIAIEANGQIDYFGRTVNVAARVEGLAGADELVLSWTSVDDADVTAFLEEARGQGDAITTDKRPVKGVNGEVDIVRVAVKLP